MKETRMQQADRILKSISVSADVILQGLFGAWLAWYAAQHRSIAAWFVPAILALTALSVGLKVYLLAKSGKG
jgi:heme A synthase